ncbi:DUF6268 family outer membrane beta-barrel protein [Luteolibacter luteus]|uniref:DUF6268 domain-containing protein n=1 Tax=Luteolibacter luteus TaxID=2728835 RepID=A0A858REQ5_9BACT|nr:DUF6268 family outer membrane beta-barrel protein [Luteolibacter luteus]QJE95091.1 hypothetical protein HHL09_04650 [Luteolibacter luteus]
MTKSLSLLTASFSFLAGPALAGSPAPITTTTSESSVSEANPLSFFDAFRVSAYGNFGMEFDNSAVELDAYQAELHTFLSKPLTFGDFSLLPTFRYEGTFLRYDGNTPFFPVGDEELHSLELPLYLIHMTQGSPWIYGAWIQPSLSTDFDHIDSDDIFLDLAVGVGYKFSNRLYVGVGAAGFDLFGNESLIPGAGFIWMPTDDIMVRLIGATFVAEWQASQDWKFGIDVRSAGGVWNIDDKNQSRTLDFTSYRAGIHAQRRLVDTWWLEGGAGFTFANEINLRTPDGLGLYESSLGDLDEGVYGYLALRKAVW